MTVDPCAANHADIYKLLIGAIVPRPIALVSSLSPDGIRNLAPFSFFTCASSNPPVICFCPTRRQTPDPRKDTLRNISLTREFVVNVVSEDFAEKMNATSGDYPPGVDEFEVSGLTPIASELVKPARVAESRVHFECKLYLAIELSALPGGGNLVLGEVLRIHVADDLVENFKIDADKLAAVGRMGGASYARTRDRFDLIRPKV